MRPRTGADIEESRSLGLALMVRRSRRLTLRQLSAMSGATPSNLSCYESGKQMPQLDSLTRIMRAMDLPLGAVERAQRLVERATGRNTAPQDPADGTLPPENGGYAPTRQDALRLAQEAGKAVAHVVLAFMELQAGGWERE
jgi:transcriptional regulator with XRE-family HTH domain